jgi:hypothetical protein
MKFDCEKCGKIDEALLNGYGVGDRILEGVMFKVKKADDGTYSVESVSDWKTDPYLRGLNESHWMGAVKDEVEDMDIFQCPHCKGDVVPDDMLSEF